MAIFKSKESKEDKKLKEIEKFMERYQLDEINDKDLKIIKNIANDLVGNNLIKAGMALSFAKVEEQAKVSYLSAIVQQNWIMIRQLNNLNNKIDELINK
ncbi:hypothetical protein [Peptostreptococcus sp.]|uniref:hypothetical protein n=1 Tax=Peptostreptococcus sp. TaxID=1262 RepID=UPI001D8F0060|nr:hypothetical protein [Peptostreptococcus sp.]MBS5596857.1 hypothetical protein [Peptostreptococcus sp.]